MKSENSDANYIASVPILNNNNNKDPPLSRLYLPKANQELQKIM